MGRVMSISRWEAATEWPLTAAAVGFLVVYAVPIVDGDLSRPAAHGFRIASWVIWIVFAADFAMRMVLAERRLRYAAKHWLDVLIIALPLLRPLRLLRLVTLLKVLNRRATSGLRGRVVVYVIGGAALLAFCGALAVLDAERANPEANITSFGDALWWAMTTMTTVGYGDRYPTTTQGRLAAVGLMVGGIALLGAVTATLASWLVDNVRGSEQEQTADLMVEIRRLHARLDQLEGVSSRAVSVDPPP
jgi:voltage-gated potassium channel